MARSGARGERTPLPKGFGSIWSVVALDLVGFGLVIPILPVFAARHHASPSTIGLLVASYSLAQLLCAPLWGRASDRIGRRPVLVASLVGTALGSLLTGLAPAGTLGLALLFAGRVVDGASGASVGVAQAAVADIATPEQRSQLLGLLAAAYGVGFVAGPAIGGLCALVSPRLPFLVAAGLAGLNAATAWRRLPETRPALDLTDPAHVRADGPAALVPAFRDPVLLGLVGVGFLTTTAFGSFEGTFSLFARAELDLAEASTYGVFAAIGVLIVAVQGGLVRRMVARSGEAVALRAGLVLMGVGLAVVALVTQGGGWGVAAPGIAVLTVGQGLITPTLASALAGRARPDRRGQVLSAQQSAAALARIVGPAAGGALFQHVGHAAPLVLGTVLLALALTVLSTRRTPAAGPSGSPEAVLRPAGAE